MPKTSHPSPALLQAALAPKLVTVLREGYGLAALRADALAGLTVAIVALPLSMAIAIASGVGPERGLYSTIIGGFLISALGGSRFQIGGPAGAFIVLVAACVAQTGVAGLVLATALSGVFLLLAGVLRLGSYIRYIPYPVTVGFTAGIAVIIFASQIKDLAGLHLQGAEPAALIPKLGALWQARGGVNPVAVAMAVGVVGVIVAVKRWRPGWPGMLLAVALASGLAALLHLPVDTIGARFGALPRTLPLPSLPDLRHGALVAAVPWAVSFALLGAIESLLSAVVADGMSGRQHRSNTELVAQGVANIVTALFGGICVTGTIARTATNVRAGSRGPVSGMLHALFVASFMLIAAPLAGYIPLAALAGVLAVVAWNMAERAEFWQMVRARSGDAVVLLVTFLLVIFRDLTEGIVVGFALAGVIFIARMARDAGAEFTETPIEQSPDRVVCRLHGPWFFGAAARLGSVLDSIADRPRELVLDMADVPMIDTSGLRSLHLLARRVARQGGVLVIAGARPALRRPLHAALAGEGHVRFAPDGTEPPTP